MKFSKISKLPSSLLDGDINIYVDTLIREKRELKMALSDLKEQLDF